MKERVFDIKLMHEPITQKIKGENNAYRGWFDDRIEGLIKGNARTLSETPKHPTGFIAIKGQDPLAGHDPKWALGGRLTRS